MSRNEEIDRMDAKLKQLLSVRYVDNQDNMTEEQKRDAYRMQDLADQVAVKRAEGIPLDLLENWTDRFKDHQLHAWAICPDTDPYADLLVADESNGVDFRQRLPGVSASDLKNRKFRLQNAFDAVRKKMIEQQTKRGRAR